MNFEFSEDQNLLREQARKFLQDNCPTTAVRRVLNAKAGHDADLWRKVIDMGWTATAIPEEFGGLGLGYLELCVIAEELGRAVAPVPFSSSVYLATEAILLAGSQAQKEKWLPKLAAGDVIGTFAMAEGAGRTSPKSLRTAVSGGRITGTKTPVPDAAIAGVAVVLARHDGGDGAALYLVELGADTPVTDVPMIDPTRGHGTLALNGAACEALGAPGAGWSLTQTLLNRAAVLMAWEQIGGSEAALEQARAYALGRYAFGRPIASYQAIKHKLANMYVKNTLARSNGYYGAWALNANAAELPVAAATARVSATQAYYFASKENIQTHGGMGYTWEFDCQFYYRRAKVLSVAIGSETQWQEKLISAIEQTRAA
ncbi:MAG: acyl-CoA dehydrogenase family protein [Gammaproteobacteria bacterium]